MTRFCLSVLLPALALSLGAAAAAVVSAAPAAPIVPKPTAARAPATRTPATRPAATTTRPASTRPAATTQSSEAALNPASNPLAAVDEAKAAFERGDYPETLRIVGRVLALKGRAAEGIDRYEVLMLRADAQLHTKAQANALQALDEAAKLAVATEDDKRAADARALAVLVRRSRQMHFTPKVSPQGKTRGPINPIDIADPKQRPDALAALYAEEKVLVKSKVVAAEKARTLPPVATALKVVLPLRDLELAANGGDSETRETIKQLVDRVHTLMAKSLDDMTKRVIHISQRASELINVPLANGGFLSQRRGLDRQDKTELQNVIETCKQIVTSCGELTEQFDAGKPFEDLEDQARDTAERADDALKEDYSR
jgi:hypothetical protein